MGEQQIRQGALILDHNQRYTIYEPDRLMYQMITLTSGLIVELWRAERGTWIVGRVEGDGQDYWCFTRTGGKIKLAVGMVVRYLEPASMLNEDV